MGWRHSNSSELLNFTMLTCTIQLILFEFITFYFLSINNYKLSVTQKNNQKQLCLKLNAAIITKEQDGAEPTATIQNTHLPSEVEGEGQNLHTEKEMIFCHSKTWSATMDQ